MRIPGLVVVILTLDEEVNLPQALVSVGDRAPVVVFDSGSRDATAAIARAGGAELVVHPFTDYASQRNAALAHVRDRFRWVFFLDADERVPEPLWREIDDTVRAGRVDGAYVGLRVRMLGAELTHGVYRNAAVLRLMRTQAARFVRASNERVDDRGWTVTTLRTRLVHDDRRGLAAWARKHVGYAEREAALYLQRRAAGPRRSALVTAIAAARGRTKAQRVAAARELYDRLPLGVRPWLQLARATVWLGAWRDGIPGLTFAVMKSLAYPLLIDLLIAEGARERAWGQVHVRGATQRRASAPGATRATAPARPTDASVAPESTPSHRPVAGPGGPARRAG